MSIKQDTNLCISVRNPLSDYEVREKVTFNPSECIEQDEGARQNPHHLSLKWEGNKKAAMLEALDVTAAKAALKKKKCKEQIRDINEDDSGSWVPILAVECRGLEPYAYHPIGDEFIVTSQGGVKFSSEVDVSEGDWADYDEENDASVSLSDVEFKFEAI